MAFMLGHCYRLKLTVTITWNRNDNISIFCIDFLGITVIPGIAGIGSCFRIFLITPMGIHFILEYFLQYQGMQLLQKLTGIGFCLELG